MKKYLITLLFFVGYLAIVFGAIAGMVSGAVMVFVWKFVISGFGGAFAIYELLPAFILSSVAIVVTSLLTKKPSAEIEAEFDEVKAMTKA